MEFILIATVCLILLFLLILAVLPMTRQRRHKKPTWSDDPAKMVRDMQGTKPGGMYVGIMSIPGDPNGVWTEGEKYETCPACGEGTLIYYWQKEYYHLRCDACKYLYDTGMSWRSQLNQ